jgi:hypothetical protein
MALQTAQPVIQGQATQTDFTSKKGLVLEDETPVRLRLNRTISSADAHVGDTVDFEALDDITVNGTLVISKGGLAFATVTEAQAKRRMARGGKLDINIDYAKLVSGDKAALRAVKDVKGGGHTGAMVGGIVATSLVFFPAAPFFLFMHGKDISIPKGTEITAYVNGDVKLDIAKFQPAAPVDMPSESAAASPPEKVGVMSAELNVESDPPGADIEVDGSFVGNTPSSVGVEAGQHVIKISKNGFNPWERKIKSSTGTVRVSANLVPMQAATDVPASSAVIQQENGAVKSPALVSSEPPPSPNTSIQDDPAVNDPSSKVEEVRSTAPPAKNNVMVAFLGVSSGSEKGERHDGVRIDGITLGGPADAAGLKLGDYILAIDNHYLFTVDELESEAQSRKLGTKVAVRYRRYSTINETFLIIGGSASTK